MFDSWKYKDPLIPGCVIDKEASTNENLIVKCDVQKVLGRKIIEGRSTVELSVGMDGRVLPLNDGGIPVPMMRELQDYVKRYIRE